MYWLIGLSLKLHLHFMGWNLRSCQSPHGRFNSDVLSFLFGLIKIAYEGKNEATSKKKYSALLPYAVKDYDQINANMGCVLLDECKPVQFSMSGPMAQPHPHPSQWADLYIGRSRGLGWSANANEDGLEQEDEQDYAWPSRSNFIGCFLRDYCVWSSFNVFSRRLLIVSFVMDLISIFIDLYYQFPYLLFYFYIFQFGKSTRQFYSLLGQMRQIRLTYVFHETDSVSNLATSVIFRWIFHHSCPMVIFFNRHVSRYSDGKFWLVNPWEISCICVRILSD